MFKQTMDKAMEGDIPMAVSQWLTTDDKLQLSSSRRSSYFNHIYFGRFPSSILWVWVHISPQLESRAVRCAVIETEHRF